jgi:uncharacterized protein YecE (DUF72 family)
MPAARSKPGTIRVGVGGWTYAPWRDNFYPARWPHARELDYASRALGMIEVNGTYYRLQSPATFAKWRDATPEGFVFALKATRFATSRRVLAQAGESVERFVGSGIAELAHKLGPILWQLAPTRRYDPEDLEAFLALLPAKAGGVKLRHALEVRHASFRCAEYVALARRYKVATVFTDSAEYPSFADVTGGFVYARLMRARASRPQGYSGPALAKLAVAAREWRDGSDPEGLPRVASRRAATSPRDVFVLFINGAKERAPAAALALQRRLG